MEDMILDPSTTTSPISHMDSPPTATPQHLSAPPQLQQGQPSFGEDSGGLLRHHGHGHGMMASGDGGGDDGDDDHDGEDDDDEDGDDEESNNDGTVSYTHLTLPTKA